MSRTMRAAVLAMPFLGGCGLVPWLAETDSVEVAEVFRSTRCGTPDAAARLRLLPDRAAVAALRLEVDGTQLVSDGPYALVEMGRREGGGYQLAVSRHAERRGDVLRLYASFIAPSQDSPRGSAQTSPCVLVSLPSVLPRRLELIDESGAVRAEAEW